jgi:hypothetical protein
METFTLTLLLALGMGLGFRALQQLSNGTGIKGNGPVVAEISAIYYLRAKKGHFPHQGMMDQRILYIESDFNGQI